MDLAGLGVAADQNAEPQLAVDQLLHPSSTPKVPRQRTAADDDRDWHPRSNRSPSKRPRKSRRDTQSPTHRDRQGTSSSPRRRDKQGDQSPRRRPRRGEQDTQGQQDGQTQGTVTLAIYCLSIILEK